MSYVTANHGHMFLLLLSADLQTALVNIWVDVLILPVYVEGGNQTKELYTCHVIGDLGMLLNQRELPTKGVRKHFAPLR